MPSLLLVTTSHWIQFTHIILFWRIWKVRMIFFFFCYLRNIKYVISTLPSFDQYLKWFLLVIKAQQSLNITGGCVLEGAGRGLEGFAKVPRYGVLNTKPIWYDCQIEAEIFHHSPFSKASLLLQTHLLGWKKYWFLRSLHTEMETILKFSTALASLPIMRHQSKCTVDVSSTAFC